MKFYLLWIEDDLLGDWSFCKMTGTDIKSERKQVICCESRTDALQMLDDFEYKLRQKGFIYFDAPNDVCNYNIN